MNPFDISGRVVVVTGAAGRLGRQFTESLTKLGAKVAAIDVTERLHTMYQGREDILTITAGVTSRESLEAALTQIQAAWGAPYGLVNNAALDSPPDSSASENGPFETYPEESIDKILDVNVKGVALCCQVFGGAMAEAGRGSIVNIGSIYGLVSPVQDIYEFRREGGEQFYKPVAYSISKSALYNLTRYLATYWGKQGVRVNTMTLAGVFDNQDPRFLEGYLARMPIGRMANPDEYNGTVAYLMSDASVYMTGSNLVIDGGWTAW